MNITSQQYFLLFILTDLLAAMWGAGLSFHRCHAEINVPVDPYLDNVFDGEEGSRGIRFFTHGYDVYSPHRVLVTHDYVNDKRLIAILKITTGVYLAFRIRVALTACFIDYVLFHIYALLPARPSKQSRSPYLGRKTQE